MIKLIVSDIDGTLVPEGTNTIDPELFSMIRALKKQGVYFAVASGRHISSVQKLFAPVLDDIFFITSNGAYIGTRKKSLSIKELAKDICMTLFDDFENEIHQSFLVETPELAYTSSQDPDFINTLIHDYDYDLNLTSSLHLLDRPIIKISLNHPENIKQVDPKWLLRWNHLCKAVISGKNWIDFIDPETNKGTALSHLQATLGISIDETLAFGDQDNDIEMLKQAYYSFAVESANANVKNAARFTCGSCNEQGVLKMIRTFFPDLFYSS